MNCRSEGELRAYLDGELPPGDLEATAAHLETCAACAAAAETLAARASTVAAWLAELGGVGRGAHVVRGPACPLAERPLPRALHLPPRRVRTWVPLAALAACLALAVILFPKHTAPTQLTASAQAPPPVVAPAPAATPPSAVQPVQLKLHPHPARPRAQAVEYFVALDDEPFEIGEVRRVALGPREVPADVVYSPDGRPRAIRLVDEPRN